MEMLRLKSRNKKAELKNNPFIQSVKKRKALLANVLSRWHEQNPNPRCELYYETPYQLLVSVVLSAQATDKTVNRCMEPLYRAGFSIDTMLEWGEAGLLERIRSIGLAPTKAKNVHRLTHILKCQHEGQVPSLREELEALPGVGRKTANVVLGELFRHPTLAVDTHVFRVGQRLGLHQEKNVEKAEQVLLKLISSSALPKGHHWFVLHGRYICKALAPHCGTCLLKDICPSV